MRQDRFLLRRWSRGSAAAAPGEDAGFRSGWRGSRALVQGSLRTLIVGQGLGQLADGLAQVSFAQLVIFDIGRGATPGRIAGVLAVTLLPFSVVGPLAGVFIDRWDRRRTLVVTSMCRAVLALAAVGVAVSRSELLAYLGVLALLSSSRLVLDAKGAVLPRTVTAADLVQANATSGLVGMTAAFLGAVGGSTFVGQSVSAGFAAAAMAYLVAAAVFVRLPWVGGGRSPSEDAATVRRLITELHAGVAEIIANTDLRRPLVAVWAHRFLLGAGFVLIVLAADHRYHLSTSGYGLAIAVTGVAAFAGTIIAPWLAGRWRAQALLPVAFLPPAAAAVVVGYAPTLAGLLVALAVTAICFQCLKVLSDALVGRAARDAVRGRVFAIYDVLYNVAFVVAGLVMIPLWSTGEEGRLLWLIAAGFTAGWLMLARLTESWPFRPGALHDPSGADRWRARITVVLAGALPVVAFPQPSLWWAAWICLVPWLILLRRAPTAREAAVRGWWGAVGFLVSVHYWLLPNTGPFLLLVTGLVAVLWMPWAVAVWGLLSGAPSGAGLTAAVLVIPAGWTVVEAVRSWSALGGPWGLLGATQWRAPAFLAPASLGGVWLVSFLIVAANTALSVVILARRSRVRFTAAVLAAAIAGAGPVWYVLERPPSGRAAEMNVALVQPGVIVDGGRRLNVEEALTRELSPGRSEVIIWGESSIDVDLFRRPDLQARLEALAVTLGSDLLVNVDATSRTGSIEKTAVLIGPRGVLSTYQKMRLVPFGEYIPFRDALGWLSDITHAAGRNRTRGTQLVVMHTGGVAFAPLICFEIAFPDMSRRAVSQGAQLLVYQSATSTFQDSWAPDQQASLAAVRAVETGRPVVQATLTGTSAAFTAQGRRLGWFDTRHRGTVQLSVPLASRPTPFMRWGDWVLGVSFVVLAVGAITASLRAARRLGAPTGPLRRRDELPVR